MTSIPKNNLRERLLKLGYNPNLITIKPPVLDNSGVVKEEPPKASTFFGSTFSEANIPNPPVFINVDEWSDFEEDE